MTVKTTLSSVFNLSHSPTDIAGEATVDGVRTLTSRPIEVPGKFSSLFLSVNATIEAEDYLLLEAQVRVQDKWSPYYKLGMLSEHLKTSFPPQQDSFGCVSIDELVLSIPAQAYRFRIQLTGTANVAQVYSCGVKDPFVYDGKTAERLPRKNFLQEVNPISQMEQKSPERRRICSPTSLCMALQKLGQEVSLPHVMAEVHDGFANVYGNWLFNVFHAGTYPGIEAYARRFSRLEELKDFVTDQSCVLASIAFEENELPGAALTHTTGHLVLIQGWQKNQILVADPAAPNAGSVCRAYGKTEFARAWLERKQGISYIVRKK